MYELQGPCTFIGKMSHVHLLEKVPITLMRFSGFPGSSAGKESVCSRKPQFHSWVGKIWRRDRLPTPVFLGFPGSSDGKEPASNVGDLGLIPRLGRSPGRRRGNSLQYSFLENPHRQRSLAGYSP